MWILWNTMHQEYREIKYRHELRNALPSSRTHRQIEAQKKWCEFGGVDHTVMTDEIIRANPIFISNWKFILSQLACTQHIDLSPHLKSVSSMLQERSGVALGEMEHIFPKVDRALIWSSIFTLTHRGCLKAALDKQPLNASIKFEIVQ